MLIKIMLPQRTKKNRKWLRIAALFHGDERTKETVPCRLALSPFCIYMPRSTPFNRRLHPLKGENSLALRIRRVGGAAQQLGCSAAGADEAGDAMGQLHRM